MCVDPAPYFLSALRSILCSSLSALWFWFLIRFSQKVLMCSRSWIRAVFIYKNTHGARVSALTTPLCHVAAEDFFLQFDPDVLPQTECSTRSCWFFSKV